MNQGESFTAPDCTRTQEARATNAPPPPFVRTTLVRATAGVVSAFFGTVSYFALYKYAQVSEQRSVFRQILGLSCALVSRGGYM